MSIPNTITIDGPAASGKTTLGKKLADRLGYLFFDTGTMYRAVTWVALQRGIQIEDEDAVSLMATTIDIDVLPPSQSDGRSCDILADGEDITWQIRHPQVDANVSLVSSYPGVREALSAQQRRIGLRGHVVMVGRDIGTVILPEAEVKIYLEASVEERSRRRYLEMLRRGENPDYDEILTAMRRRDHIDSTRELSPLRPAENAIILNSDNLDSEQVLEMVLRLVDNC